MVFRQRHGVFQTRTEPATQSFRELRFSEDGGTGAVELISQAFDRYRVSPASTELTKLAWYHRNCVRILFIGDIFVRPGRNIVREKLKELDREQRIDLVLANGENAAAGFGITPSLADDLFDLGIDGPTTCNHDCDKRQ